MLIIGIAGGSGSGKSTVVKKIVTKLPKNSVTLIAQDSYYKDNGHLSPEARAKINFDHPSSIEFNLLIKHLDMLRKGEPIEVPDCRGKTVSKRIQTSVRQATADAIEELVGDMLLMRSQEKHQQGFVRRLLTR